MKKTIHLIVLLFYALFGVAICNAEEDTKRRKRVCGVMSFPAKSLASDFEIEKVNLFPIIVNKKAGYINRNGKVIVKPQYDYSMDQSEGMAMVTIEKKGQAKIKLSTENRAAFEILTNKHDHGVPVVL